MSTAVYAVVAGPGSPYLDWAAASAVAAKKFDSISRVVVCLDRQTLKFAKERSHHILKIADSIAIATPFEGTPRERSRWVKTQIRGLVDGDFLYLDADALLVSEVHEMIEHDADIAAVSDVKTVHEIGSWYPMAAEVLGWKIPESRYINAGVVFWRDNKKTRLLGELWHKKWQIWHNYDKSGESPDQPAFNSALVESGVKFKEMSYRYNTHLVKPARTVNDPIILHYGAAFASIHHYTILSKISRQLIETGDIEFSYLENAKISGYPWCIPYVIVICSYTISRIRLYIRVRIKRILPSSLKAYMVK